MKRLIKLLIVTAFFNALSWIILIPVWQYPDEQAHFAQVQNIAELGSTQRGQLDTSYEIALSEKVLETERDENGNNKFTYHPEYKIPYSNSFNGPGEEIILRLPKESRYEMVKKEATHNPPLYYSIGALIYKAFTAESLFARVYYVRLLSLSFFLSTIYFSYLISKLIFQKDGILRLALPSLVAFKPMLIHASTGVLPDSLTILLFSIFIYISLKMIKKGFNFSDVIIILLVIILGALTRQHFLITIALLPIIIIYLLIIDKSSRYKIVLSFTTIFLILYFAGYVFEALSFIRRFDYPESSRKIANNSLSNLNYFDHLLWSLNHSMREVWPWFWGVYRWLSLTLPPIIYRIINRLIIIALIGIFIKFVTIVKEKRFKKDFYFIFLSLVSLIYFMGLTTFDYLYRKNNGFSFGIQGRYFLPPIISFMSLVIIGFNEIFKIVLKSFSKYAILGIIILMIIFNDLSLFYVTLSYYDTSNFKAFVLQASQYKPLFFKGNIVVAILSTSVISQIFLIFYMGKFTIKTPKNINIESEKYYG